MKATSMTDETQVEQAYHAARSRYAELDVDTQAALDRLGTVAVSLHCWQGDDVAGFETPDAELSGGGIQATGNYPGRARTPDELRADLDIALPYPGHAPPEPPRDLRRVRRAADRPQRDRAGAVRRLDGLGP
jgi:L-rhamnose isomerase